MKALIVFIVAIFLVSAVNSRTVHQGKNIKQFRSSDN